MGNLVDVCEGISTRFCKVFFPCCSSRRLVIPLDFWKHIEHEGPRGVSLTAPSGNVWSVELIRDKDGGVSFHDGWEVFVADHDLKTGDFLLFEYDGNLSFTVMVFDATACEREDASHVTPGEDVVILGKSRPRRRVTGWPGGEPEILDPEIDVTMPPKSMGVRDKLPETKYQDFANNQTNTVESHSEAAHITHDDSTVANEDNMENPPEQWIEGSGEPVCRQRRIAQMKADKSHNLCGGNLTDSAGKHKEPAAKRSTDKKNRSSRTRPRVKCSRSSAVSDTVITKARMGYAVSQRRPISEHEKAKTLEAAMLFQSEHPCGLCVMQESNVYYGYYVRLPSSFTVQTPKCSREMKLWDPSNKPWKVMYVQWEDRGGLSAGWGEFVRAHNLESDDVCIFELLELDEMRVHIFRVVKEIVPLVWRDCRDKERGCRRVYDSLPPSLL